MSKPTIRYFSTHRLGTVHITNRFRGRSLCGLVTENRKGILWSYNRSDFGPNDCLSCLRAKERGDA